MQRGLPWSSSGLTPSTCAGSGVSTGPCSAWPIANMHIWDTNINAMHGVQRVICYMIMHNLLILTLTSHLLIYP
jgi:hypothetical protein